MRLRVSQSAAYRRVATIKRSLEALWSFHGRHRRQCSVCDHAGYFGAVGSPLRFDALCMRCGSLERHRQHALLIRRRPEWIDGRAVLHVAAEPCFTADYRARCAHYVVGDLAPPPGGIAVDICRIAFPEASFDTVICHQVLEHVDDDLRAIAELYRVLRPGGVALVSVPTVDTWDATLRMPAVSSPRARDLYFGQHDHLRFYGSDFGAILQQAGFVVERDIAVEPEVATFGLVRGGTIFIGRK